MSLLGTIVMCAVGLMACVALALTLLQDAPLLWFQIGLAIVAVACFAIALGVWGITHRR